MKKNNNKNKEIFFLIEWWDKKKNINKIPNLFIANKTKLNPQKLKIGRDFFFYEWKWQVNVSDDFRANERFP